MQIRDEYDPRVNQASGMVSVQAECSIDDALGLLKERAQVSGQSLLEIANATVEHRIHFGPIA